MSQRTQPRDFVIMPIPPVSLEEEAARLAALDELGILDSPAEPRFDAIVSLARQICDTPIGLISLLAGARQWFKAEQGLGVSETPLDQSVCIHTIAEARPLIIPDLTHDPRTLDNPLVTGAAALRFYAGAPLRTRNGIVLGALCVIDHAARPEGLSSQQAAALEMLAEQTMALLELRRAVDSRDMALSEARELGHDSLVRLIASEAQSEALRDFETRVIAAQRAGRIGTFDLDLASEILRPSGVFCRLHGMTEAPSYPASDFEALDADADGPLLWRSLKSARASLLQGEYRIRRADDGSLRWLARRGEFIRDATGAPVRFTGTIQDVTDAKQAEQRQAGLLAIGDRMREGSAVDAVVLAASNIVGETLQASRVGFAAIDRDGELIQVLKDWTRPGTTSLVGAYPIRLLRATAERLQQAMPLVVADIQATSGLRREPRHYEAAQIRAQIAIPFCSGGRLLGAFFIHDDRPRSWQPGEVEFIQAAADRVFTTVARLQAEADQRVLNQELGHRLKNTLAMVQAVAKQTLRHAADRDAVRAFNQRIVALATAHDVLLQQNWTAARIRAVAQGVLALHLDLARFDLAGPDLNLSPRAVLSLSMLLHELATNAVKYGSLSTEEGRVALKWSVGYDGPEATITLTWTETGGPEVAEPTRQGFGSRLMRMGLSGTGNAVLRYEPSGLVAEFGAPLSAVTTY